MKLYIVDGDPNFDAPWMDELKEKLDPRFEWASCPAEADLTITRAFIVYSITPKEPLISRVTSGGIAKHLNDYLPIPEPKLTIIRGLPGSGKTTYAQKLVAQQPDTDHFEADAFLVGKDGTYLYDYSKVPAAHDWCFNRTKDALIKGRNVVVSNTFSRTCEYQRYLDLGYPTEVITMSEEYPNIHGVPREAIDRMKERWEVTPEGNEVRK